MNTLLVTWLVLIWSGVVFDIDHFPLTNTPMYATWERQEMYKLYYQKVHNRPPFLLFQAFNRTLGHEPDDPGFIVRITVPLELMQRRVSDISDLSRETRVTTLEWDEAWRER